ncbi:MAG: hypothetical protein [Wendovervirus sonii]|uniref:Uncharacterized protein n=1 Tax=phage Lak_Megaphage_Sonny TaxID=3109229 RepID=A0ABZ0Z3S8_9CAUD|nr:MAG: hypothetical protein [phage Lak_Megaphage_Sonny]
MKPLKNTKFIEVTSVTLGCNKEGMPSIDKEEEICINKDNINVLYPLSALITGSIYNKQLSENANNFSVIYLNGMSKELIVNISYDKMLKILHAKKNNTKWNKKHMVLNEHLIHEKVKKSANTYVNDMFPNLITNDKWLFDPF